MLLTMFFIMFSLIPALIGLYHAKTEEKNKIILFSIFYLGFTGSWVTWLGLGGLIIGVKELGDFGISSIILSFGGVAMFFAFMLSTAEELKIQKRDLNERIKPHSLLPYPCMGPVEGEYKNNLPVVVQPYIDTVDIEEVLYQTC